MTRSALIIVDVQNDFIPGGALAVSDGDAIVPVINNLIQSKAFDLIVATQDWHPANHGSFAANHPGATIGSVIELNGQSQILWPVHCVQNTPGAAFVSDLQLDDSIRVFRKGTDPAIDSYSGLFDNGHRKSTGLGEYLKEQSITDVYICGLATDYCVKFTALDALQQGFRTYLVEDASRGVNLQPGDVERAIQDMREAGVQVVKESNVTPPVSLYEGRFIQLIKRGTWEYVTRKNITGIVGIVAVTDEGKLILIEQLRPPLGKYVIEIPAGLAGDVEGSADEDLATAAARELLEETGYEAREMTYLTHGVTSGGLTDEVITMFLASGLRKVGPGAGDGSEQITVHEVKVSEVIPWLNDQIKKGKEVDLKVYSGLFFVSSGIF